MRCVFYGGPHDGSITEVGRPLPPELLMPDRVVKTHAFATPAEMFDVAGPDVRRVRYWLARHNISGAPVYVLAEIVEHEQRRR